MDLNLAWIPGSTNTIKYRRLPSSASGLSFRISMKAADFRNYRFWCGFHWNTEYDENCGFHHHITFTHLSPTKRKTNKVKSHVTQVTTGLGVGTHTVVAMHHWLHNNQVLSVSLSLPPGLDFDGSEYKWLWSMNVSLMEEKEVCTHE